MEERSKDFREELSNIAHQARPLLQNLSDCNVQLNAMNVGSTGNTVDQNAIIKSDYECCFEYLCKTGLFPDRTQDCW